MWSYIKSTSYKTTFAGIAAFLTAVGDICHQVATGEWDGTRLQVDAGIVLAGVGLIFTKDHDK